MQVGQRRVRTPRASRGSRGFLGRSSPSLASIRRLHVPAMESSALQANLGKPSLGVKVTTARSAGGSRSGCALVRFARERSSRS